MIVILAVAGVFFAVAGNGVVAADSRSLLAGADNNMVILRWLWPADSVFPPKYRVYRRKEGGAWNLLTPQGIEKVRNRDRARKVLGDELFTKYQGLLFPVVPDPGKNPAAYQKVARNLQALWGMTMLSADLNPGLADLLGVRYRDRTAKNGTTYRYRLDRMDKKTGKWQTVATTGPVVPAKTVIGAPQLFQGKGGDGIAMVRWKREPRFSGYEVYRSEKKDGHFQKINRLPVVILKNRDRDGNVRYPEWIYADRSVENGTTYWYLVRGRDPFGRLSQPTRPIALTPRDQTAPGAPRKFDAREKGDSVTLSWEKSPEKDLAGYRLYRSTNYKDGFEEITDQLLSPNTVQYEEHGLPTGKTFWYCVTAVDKTGNESPRSYIAPANIRDIVPPEIPGKPTVKTEPGIFHLAWKANSDKDLAGYRVYMAHERGEKYYHLLTRKPVEETTFTCTVPETMSGISFYFKITAMDKAGNESGFSAITEARLPDVTPPRPPVIDRVRNGEGKITITWYPSSEKDVAGYDIYRYTRGENKEKASHLNGKKPLPATATNFTDSKDLELGRKYRYFLTAIDRDGNISGPSREKVGAIHDLTPPKTPHLLHAGYDADKKGIVLNWKKMGADDLAGVILYRSASRKGNYRPVSGLVRENIYVDAKANPEQEYYYRAMAFDRVRNHSGYSRTIKYVPGK